jgi:hypothetical protein
MWLWGKKILSLQKIMKKFKQNNILKIVWIVMALHILNFSIDAPDIVNEYISEDLSYNEIESFSELITESIFDIENAFAESDEQGDEDSGFVKKIVDIKFYQVAFEDEIITPTLKNIKNNSASVNYSKPFCSTIYISIFSPPPEA